MHFTHPDMIERTCSRCGQIVGVFPSGQRVLEDDEVAIICDICYLAHFADFGPAVEAPGAIDEARELWRKGRTQ